MILESSLYFQFYVQRITLLELEFTYTGRYGKATRGPPAFPWVAWGLEHTRIFLASRNGDRSHCSYGFRTAELIGETLSKQIRIRDFNPHHVMHYKAGDGTGHLCWAIGN